MGIFTKDIKTMDDLFVHQLQDVFYAENAILKAMPKMVGLVTNPELKRALETHHGETQNQVKRLEQVFQSLGAKATSVDCHAMDGLIKEAQEVSGETADPTVLDAAIVAAAQAIEHYEIARYGTLVAWARQLGHQSAITLFEETLAEERRTDKILTDLAQSHVNRAAA